MLFPPWKLLILAFLVSHFFDVASTVYCLVHEDYNWEPEQNFIIQYLGGHIGFHHALSVYALMWIALALLIAALGKLCADDLTNHRGWGRVFCQCGIYGSKILLLSAVATRLYAGYHNLTQ